MKISVIIPTYNEAEHIRAVIEQVEKFAAGSVEEVIVVDGGSDDGTTEIVGETSAKLLFSPKTGRAEQMNYGASQAVGEVLYFLHGDTLVPHGFARDIQEAIESDVSAGSFRLSFDGDSRLLAFYAYFTWFNLAALRFGDQSLFVTGDVFHAVDGFNERLALMEDNDIARRLYRVGSFSVLDSVVVTSAQKYRDVGAIRLQLIFVLIYTLYFCGVSQKRLVSLYKKLA